MTRILENYKTAPYRPVLTKASRKVAAEAKLRYENYKNCENCMRYSVTFLACPAIDAENFFFSVCRLHASLLAEK